MPVAILLPSGCVAFVMVAVLDTPMPTDGAGGTGFFFRSQAGEEDAGMALAGLRFFLVAPVAHHGYGATCSRQTCVERRDGFHSRFSLVNAPVFALQTQVKKGDPCRALAAPSNRLEVFALVPMR